MHLLGFLIGALIGLFSTPALAKVQAKIQAISVTATPIIAFDTKDTKRFQFGKLKFVGGLVLRSSTASFGALSGLRISDTGVLTSVTDTGYWFRGQVQRSKQGAPTTITNGKIAPLLNNIGLPFGNKWLSDAEGVTFSQEFALVSTEQKTRVLLYRKENLLNSNSIEIAIPFDETVRPNNGLEAIATFPRGHKYYGNVLVLRERAGDSQNENQGLILNGQVKGRFTIYISDGFAITDADFLPSGDLLLLERRFTMGQGAQARIRRITGSSIKDNAKLEGKIIFEANSNQQIDNMEGLSVFKGPFGKTRIGLISDNNHWPLQRTLYLEFLLDD